MTTEERLAVLETEVRGLKEWTASNDAKLDQLIAVTHMGKGAWLLMLKVGGAVAALIAATAAVVTLVEKILSLIKH